MRCFLLSCGVLTVMSVASAAAQAPPAEKASLEGRISNLVTGESLRKAQVILRKPEGAVAGRATTDAAGQFVIAGIQPGSYHLSAERTGYCDMDYGARSPGRPGTLIKVEAGQKLKDMDLTLVPLSSISGRLVDEERDPLPGSMVYCLRRGYLGGRQTFQPVWSGTTDEKGEFRAGGLEPGQYFVVGVASQRAPGARQRGSSAVAEEWYVATYYPNSTELDRAVPITVRAGADFEGVEIAPLRKPVVRIRGRVSPFNPESGGRPSIVLTPSGSEGLTFLGMRIGRVQDKEGSFEIAGVPQGAYVISAEWSDGSRRYQGRQALEVGNADIERLNLVMMPGADVTGRVRTRGSGNASLDKLRIRLVSQYSARPLPAAQMAADGTFGWAAVPADSYRLELDGVPEGAYLESVRVGGADVTRSGLDLTQGALPGPVELVINTEGAQLEGTVTDSDRNLRWATVALIPDASRRGQSYWYRRSETDQYGRFTLKGIAPGEYKLLAWEDIEGDAYRDPAFLKAFESAAEAVNLGAGERKSVQVKVIDAGGMQSQSAGR